MGECILTRRSVVKNESQLLADITVSGSAVTQVDISGLNIGKGEEVVLVSQFTNALGVTVALRLMFNGNYTLTNYYSQEVYADGTSVGASGVNNPMILNALRGLTSIINSKIKLTNNGHIVAQNDIENKLGTSSANITQTYHTTTFTTTSITSIRVACSNTDGIGIGSRFQLYKVGGV